MKQYLLPTKPRMERKKTSVKPRWWIQDFARGCASHVMHACIYMLFKVFLWASMWMQPCCINLSSSTCRFLAAAAARFRMDLPRHNVNRFSLHNARPLSSFSLDFIGFLFMIAANKALVWKTVTTQSVHQLYCHWSADARYSNRESPRLRS